LPLTWPRSGSGKAEGSERGRYRGFGGFGFFDFLRLFRLGNRQDDASLGHINLETQCLRVAAEVPQETAGDHQLTSLAGLGKTIIRHAANFVTQGKAASSFEQCGTERQELGFLLASFLVDGVVASGFSNLPFGLAAFAQVFGQRCQFFTDKALSNSFGGAFFGHGPLHQEKVRSNRSRSKRGLQPCSGLIGEMVGWFPFRFANCFATLWRRSSFCPL